VPDHVTSGRLTARQREISPATITSCRARVVAAPLAAIGRRRRYVSPGARSSLRARSTTPATVEHNAGQSNLAPVSVEPAAAHERPVWTRSESFPHSTRIGSGRSLSAKQREHLKGVEHPIGQLQGEAGGRRNAMANIPDIPTTLVGEEGAPR